MFYTEGWRPITDVPQAFRHVIDERPSQGDEEEITAAERPKDRRERKSRAKRLEHMQLWRVLHALRQIGILLPSGCMSQGSPALLYGLENLKTRHVDLETGIVGSGTFWGMLVEEDPADHRLELERQYGNFLGCAVMVNADEVNNALRSEFSWHPTAFDLSDMSAEQQTAQVEATTAVDPPRRARGRPKHGDGLVEQMVHIEFGRRLGPDGDLQGAKKDAVEAEAIEWVKKQTCGIVPVSPTTMRSYLHPLYVPQVRGKG